MIRKATTSCGKTRRVTGHAYVLILAGGGGTRLWPASRRKRPEAVPAASARRPDAARRHRRRVRAIAPPERIAGGDRGATRSTTSARGAVAAATRTWWSSRRRATPPPCIGLGALEVQRRDPDGVLAVLPSDQHVADERAPYAARSTARSRSRKPRRDRHHRHPPDRAPRPASATSSSGDAIASATRALVNRFVEKPDRATAERYLASGATCGTRGCSSSPRGASSRRSRQHLPALRRAARRRSRADPERGGASSIRARRRSRSTTA